MSQVVIAGRAQDGRFVVGTIGSVVWLDEEGARFVRDELARMLLDAAKAVKVSRKDIRP
jgi:hypothetical protein